MQNDDSVRAGRCSLCCRPVFPALDAAERDEPPAPPELCDYCIAASR